MEKENTKERKGREENEKGGKGKREMKCDMIMMERKETQEKLDEEEEKNKTKRD